jgi:hypothetical protein
MSPFLWAISFFQKCQKVAQLAKKVAQSGHHERKNSSVTPESNQSDRHLQIHLPNTLQY